MVVDTTKIPLSMDEIKAKKQEKCGMFNAYKTLTSEEAANYQVSSNSRYMTAEEANSRQPSFLEQLARAELRKQAKPIETEEDFGNDSMQKDCRDDF